MAKSKYGLALAAGVLALCVGHVSASHAATVAFKFYKGGNGYTPYDGSIGLPLDAYNQTKGELDACAGNTFSAGGCSEVIGDPLQYGTTLGITATANGTDEVWHDYNPNFGGLGVDSGGPNSSDHINGDEVLRLQFSTAVELQGIATLFASGHSPFNEPNTDDDLWKFGLRVGGSGSFNEVSFSDANAVQLSLIGTIFEFTQLDNMPSFYVSGLIVDDDPQQINPVPLPGALPLLLSGLGLLWYGRRRKAA